jgi:hypothetical protein
MALPWRWLRGLLCLGRPCSSWEAQNKAGMPDPGFCRHRTVVPEKGFEPPRPCEQVILSHPCLPFHHSGPASPIICHANSVCQRIPSHMVPCAIICFLVYTGQTYHFSRQANCFFVRSVSLTENMKESGSETLKINNRSVYRPGKTSVWDRLATEPYGFGATLSPDCHADTGTPLLYRRHHERRVSR